MDRINHAEPRLVVHSGDLSINGAEDGHLHEARMRCWEGINLVWCPSTAFPATEPRSAGRTPLGWVEHRLVRDRHEAVVVADEGLERFELESLKEHGRYSFPYQTPACPPALI